MRQAVGNLPPCTPSWDAECGWDPSQETNLSLQRPSAGENSQLSSLVGHYRRGPGRLDDSPSHFAVDPLPPQYCIHNCSQGAEFLCSWFSFPAFLFFSVSSLAGNDQNCFHENWHNWSLIDLKSWRTPSPMAVLFGGSDQDQVYQICALLNQLHWACRARLKGTTEKDASLNGETRIYLIFSSGSLRTAKRTGFSCWHTSVRL